MTVAEFVVPSKVNKVTCEAHHKLEMVYFKETCIAIQVWAVAHALRTLFMTGLH